MITLPIFLFFIFAGIAVGGALSLIFAREPIHSALALILVMVALAVLYLLMGAGFISAVQIIVYAGAIMVLFVFVIMLLNAGVESRTQHSIMARWIGIPLAVFLIGDLAYWMARGARALLLAERSGTLAAGPVSTQELSLHLFQSYLFPFEITSILILIAVLGAVVLAREGAMNGIPLSYFLVLSAILFGLGVLGFIFKRNIVTIFMCIELMLNAVNLAFIAFSRALGQFDGLVFVFFVIVVAAAEAAVGLAIVLLIARNRRSLNIENVDEMKS